MSKVAKKSVHDIAVRLVEGGIEEIDGLCFALRHEPYIFDPCLICDLDCLCHKGSNILDVCEECDAITNEDCFLVLMNNK